MRVTPPLCASCGQPASEALAGPEHGWECRNEACPEFGQSIDANEPREPELETWRAPPGDRIPNHPRFDVLLYSGVEAAAAGADSARALFARHGWGGAWVDGIFDFHHFHSTSHEALAVVAGRAAVELGGPLGRAFDVSAGDVLVLPAGTGHRRASSDRGFTVVGAYPAGQEDYDLLRGDDPAQLEAARRRIAALGAPPQDPVGGEGVARWR
jgi:uncharacterized protein YjlB